MSNLEKYIDETIDSMVNRVMYHGFTVKQMKEQLDPYKNDMSDSLLEKYNNALEKLQSFEDEMKEKPYQYRPEGNLTVYSATRKVKLGKRFVLTAAAAALSLAAIVSGCRKSKDSEPDPSYQVETQTDDLDDENIIIIDEPQTDIATAPQEVVAETEFVNDETQLTEDQIRNIYENVISSGISNLTLALPNGVNISADQYVHNYLIANIDSLSHDDKLLMASSDYINMSDWLDFSSQISVAMTTVTNDDIPFDASTMFKDQEVCDDINTAIRLFANYNESRSEESQAEFQNFARDYIQNIETKIEQNPAAVELVLRIFDQAAQPGIELLREDDVISFSDIFEKPGCLLETVRVKLGEKLEIDPILVRKDCEYYDEIIDIAELAQNEFMLHSNDSINEARQIRFVANMNELSRNQITAFADNLDLQNMGSHYKEFCDQFSDAVINGTVNTSNFDASLIFVNNEEDSENINEVISMIERYRNATDEEKTSINEEFEEFYYDYSMDVTDRLVKNPAASVMMLDILSKVEESNLGIHISDDLKTILVDDGSLDGCITIDQTHIEDDEVVSERTFFEQAYDSLNETIHSYMILSQDSGMNYDAGNSIYAKVVLDYGDEVSKETLNRHDVVVEAIKEKTKDIAFVERESAEDFLSRYLDLYDYDYDPFAEVGDYEYAPLGGSGGETVTTENVDVPDGGKGNRDESLPLWTPEQIKEAEEKAEKSLKETETTEVPITKDDEKKLQKESEVVTGVVVGEEDKGEQDVTGIVVDETEETKVSPEEIVTKDENGNDIDYNDDNYIIDENGNVYDKNGNLVISGDGVIQDVPQTEVQTPETQESETQTPETQTPETQTPETQTPETDSQSNGFVSENGYEEYSNGYWKMEDADGVHYYNENGIEISEEEFNNAINGSTTVTPGENSSDVLEGYEEYSNGYFKVQDSSGTYYYDNQGNQITEDLFNEGIKDSSVVTPNIEEVETPETKESETQAQETEQTETTPSTEEDCEPEYSEYWKVENPDGSVNYYDGSGNEITEEQFNKAIDDAMKNSGNVQIESETYSTETSTVNMDEAVPVAASFEEETVAPETKESETPVTEAQVSEPPVTEAQVSETPVTEAQVSETPVTEAQVSETPVTEAQVSETPVTEAQVPETPVTEAQVPETPASDKAAEIEALQEMKEILVAIQETEMQESETYQMVK